ALEAVAKKENIEVSDEDLEKEYENIAKQYNVEIERAKEIPADTLSGDIRVRKALEAVKAKAKITDVEKKPEAPAPAETAEETAAADEAAPEASDAE
ncbi:MAG: trigger factor, partial [Clostridia bacterium]|nr:trigger factor [Clostridia bacterium]